MEKATLLIQRRTRAWLATRHLKLDTAMTATELEAAQKNIKQDMSVLRMLSIMKVRAHTEFDKRTSVSVFKRSI